MEGPDFRTQTSRLTADVGIILRTDGAQRGVNARV